MSTTTAETATTALPPDWAGDHTALVHVLWRARNAGLLAEDSKTIDKLASFIRSSAYQRAVQELSAAGQPPVTFTPDPARPDYWH